jgi:exopolysaccharide biosynthesis polyprenyl glycosylphosphotransferase
MALTMAQTRSRSGALRTAQRVLVRALQGFVKSRRGIQLLVVLVDALALAFSFISFYVIRVNRLVFDDPMMLPISAVLLVTAMIVVVWEILFWFSGIYISVHNRALFDEYIGIMKIVVAGFIMLVIALFAWGSSFQSDVVSNRFVSLAIYFLMTTLSLGLGRWMIRGAVRRLRRRGIGLRRTIIVGDSLRSRQLLEMFDVHPELGYSVLGTVETGGDASLEFTRRSLGGIEDIDRIIHGGRIEVTILGMEHQRELVPKLMTETAVAETTIKVVPDLYDIVSGQARAQHLYGIPLIEIYPQIMPVWEQNIKRGMDILFSLLMLLVGSPIWLIMALAVKLTDGGPIFYSQERVGLSGRTFMMHKFRSMRIDAESKGISWTLANDPRVTSVGRFIRRTHIDEIPQLFNVLLGDMSLVGPRPERPFYVEKYSKILPSYPRRLRVKPGVTGWNQVHLEDMVESAEFVQERLRHDFFYIENMSLRLDMEIIFRTILRILQRKGQA